jgi:integrase
LLRGCCSGRGRRTDPSIYLVARLEPTAERGRYPERDRPHCLRHSFATLLIHNGASVKQSSSCASGHSTPMVTLNTYVGEWPEAHEKTRSLVDVALGRVPQMCPPEAVDQ